MQSFFKTHKLVWLLPLAFILYNWSYQDLGIFWYMYTFVLLVLMSAGIIFGSVYDELPTWKSLLLGLAGGILLYGLVLGAYQVFQMTSVSIEASFADFQEIFAPTTIWHYLLLMFIIVPGEEIFWRGIVQQQLKQYMPTAIAVVAAGILFGLALALSGFWPGALVAALAGILLGYLYEWKRSMPLLIITHLIVIVLLFLIAPISV